MGLINICNQREGSVLLFKDCCSCSSLRTFLCCRAAQRYGFLGNVRRSSTGRDKLTPTRRMSTGKPYLKDYMCPFDRELSSSAVLQSIPGIFVWLSNFLGQPQRWQLENCQLPPRLRGEPHQPTCMPSARQAAALQNPHGWFRHHSCWQQHTPRLASCC